MHALADTKTNNINNIITLYSPSFIVHAWEVSHDTISVSGFTPFHVFSLGGYWL